MKILFIGDVVGAPGRRMLKSVVGQYRREGKVQAVVANAENAAAGAGITPAIADEIFASGVDCITLGVHVWDQKEIPPYLDRDRRIVRPLNLPSECPGRGWVTIPTDLGPLHVVSLLGRVFMDMPIDSPFKSIDALLAGPLPRNGITLVDFHAEATSEKVCMGWYLDGKVSAVVGSHTHVQTSDGRVFPNGTGYITDLGMTGAFDSVIGMKPEEPVSRFLGNPPGRLESAYGPSRVEGAVFEIDTESGKCLSVEAIRIA